MPNSRWGAEDSQALRLLRSVYAAIFVSAVLDWLLNWLAAVPQSGPYKANVPVNHYWVI